MLKELQVNDQKPDIICLQEVDHFDEIYKPQLELLGYDMEVEYRREIDAKLIGWDKTKFKLLKKQKINHEDLIPRYGEHGKLFKRGNVGITCLLEHLETQEKILVTNTHLHWNPKFDFVKYGQGFWLLN